MKTLGEGALHSHEHIERVEAELDAFVEKRAREAQDQERVEELWAKSEREHHAKRRQANGAAWIDYHERLCRWHQDIALDHEDKANHVRQLLIGHGLLTEQKEEPMNEKNGHAGEVAS